MLWLQELLARLYASQAVDGDFGPITRANLAAFQARHGLLATGSTNDATWQALKHVSPVPVAWGGIATVAATRRAGSGPAPVLREPKSASLPARGYEIPEFGAAHPSERAGSADP